MDYRVLHGWHFNPSQAIALQKQLAGRVCCEGEPANVRLVAGVDISVNRATGSGRAAVVVISYPEMEIVEVATAGGAIDFPYVPGLLSFREIPLSLEALSKISAMPDLVLVDGHGLAHPRRLGIASHLGLFLNVPTIGCAKSRLCGEHEEPGKRRGDRTVLLDGDEVIGTVLRTKDNTRPVYVSIGNNTSLPSAVDWVLALTRGYRLPEPARLAHLAAGGNLRLAGAEIGV